MMGVGRPDRFVSCEPNDRFRRNFGVRTRSGEGPESTLLGHSAFAPGTALPAPKPTFAPVRGSIGASG